MSLKAKRSEREGTASKERPKGGSWSSRVAALHYKNIFTPHQSFCQQVPKPPHKTAQLRRNKPTSDAAKTRCQEKWFHRVQLVKHRFTDTSRGGRVCSPWQHSPRSPGLTTASIYTIAGAIIKARVITHVAR